MIKRIFTFYILVLLILSSSITWAALKGTVAQTSRSFDRIFIIILENKSRESVMSTPYFKELADRGVTLTNYYGASHPSQPNYIAMVAGDPLVSDNDNHNLSQRNLVDLLEAKGVSWKAYAENYPGQCFDGARAGFRLMGEYVRKHNPFISFDNIRNNPKRCSRIVNADELAADLTAGPLSSVSFYIPNGVNSMHDQTLAFGADWLKGFLEPKLKNQNFTKNTLIVITFDETASGADNPATNPVYAVLLGPLVHPGSSDPARYTHYSLLRTIEENFDLGTLGRNDETAAPFARCNFTGGCSQR